MAATAGLAAKVKTGLDETRTLILGAQILLGFQFQGAFQSGFDALPPGRRQLDVIALVLLLAAAGLLIAPTAFHRIAERGACSGRMLATTGRLAELALLPFGAGLGLDLTITIERAWGDLAGAIGVGIGFACLALAAWYGVGYIMKRATGAPERVQAREDLDACETAPLHARIEQMLTEARVILPGAQALLGFQLAIVLTSTFDQLPLSSRLIHGGALLLVALSVILLMTPPALHRIVWAGEDSEDLLRHGGRITVSALLPLGVAMAAETYVVLLRITGSGLAAWGAASVVLACLFGLWFAWPFAARGSRSRAPVSMEHALRK